MSSDILEVCRQHSFLASVIAGFAIAAAIQLLSLLKRKPIVTVTIAAFLLFSIAEVFTTSLFVMIMTFIIGPPEWTHPSERWLAHFMGGMGVMPVLGLFFSFWGWRWLAGCAPSFLVSSPRPQHCWRRYCSSKC